MIPFIKPGWPKTTGELHEELVSIANDEDAISDRFYRTLAFGTAGLRGVMGAGTNRMNQFTVGLAAKGLADTLENKTVAIGYDCRHHSEELPVIRPPFWPPTASRSGSTEN